MANPTLKSETVSDAVIEILGMISGVPTTFTTCPSMLNYNGWSLLLHCALQELSRGSYGCVVMYEQRHGCIDWIVYKREGGI